MNATAVLVTEEINEDGGVDQVVDVQRDYNPAEHLITSINGREVYKIERVTGYFSWLSMAFMVRYRVRE